MERRFIWERAGWPHLKVDMATLCPQLSRAAFGQGEIVGMLRALSAADAHAIERLALAQTIRVTARDGGEAHESPIETSIAAALAQLLDDEPAEGSVAAQIDGVTTFTLDTRRNARALVTKSRLLRWHRELFTTTRFAPETGALRSDDLPNAPAAERIDDDVNAFLLSLAGPTDHPPLVRAALALLVFVTLRPFAAGNGRIARGIADLVIARGLPAVAPYVGLGPQIATERAAFDAALMEAQRGDLDVTAWAAWFIDCYARATAATIGAIDGRLRAGKFWRDTAGVELNARQRRVLERYLSADAPGNISSRVYSAIAQTSTDSAQRDLADLARKRIIVANDGKARKTSYRLRDEYVVRRPTNVLPSVRGEFEPGPER